MRGASLAIRPTVPLLLLAMTLPGLCLLLAARRRPPTFLLLLAIPPSLGALAATAVGVLLVCAGKRLSLEAVLAGEALLVLPALVLARRRDHPPLRQALRTLWREARRRRHEYLVLFLLIGVAIVAHGRPSEWVLSQGHDASNYLVQAAYQTRQASAFPGDAAPEVYAADFAHATYHLNSTVGPPGPDGGRQFPFPPFFKVLLAIAMLIGGLPWALHAPLALGVLAALCGHLALVRMARRRVHALFGTALLLGSPLMLQFMRVTVSEVCLLFVSATGLALLYAADTRTGGALAGLVLSLTLLVRVDALLLWAGVVAALAVGGLAGGLKTQPAIVRAFAIAFLAGSTVAWALALHTSSHYLLAHLGRVGPWVLPTLVVAAAAYGLVLTCRTWPAVDRLLALRVSTAPHLTRGVAVIVTAVAAYALVVRPLWQLALWLRMPGGPPPLLPAQGGGSALVVLGYVTVLTTVTGLAGVAWVLWKEPARWLPWTGTFLVGALVYLDDLRHSPTPYWASRRLLCTVLPLCVAGTVFMLERWAGSATLTRRRVCTAATLVAANLVAHNARLTLGRGIDYVGAASSLHAVAAAFRPTDVVLVDGELDDAEGLRLGLRYLHGIEALAPVLSTVDDDDLVRFWRLQVAQGRRLHVLSASAAGIERLRRLFVVERASLELRYEHWRAKGPEAHRVAFDSLRLIGTAGARTDPSWSAVRAVDADSPAPERGRRCGACVPGTSTSRGRRPAGPSPDASRVEPTRTRWARSPAG